MRTFVIMKSYPLQRLLFLLVLFILPFSNSCTNAQSSGEETDLIPVEFQKKLKENPGAPVVDVRTPGEFAKGHLAAALNIDWRNDSFEVKIGVLGKDKPVFVYCQSGMRSGSAAKKMRSMGFLKVYEMKGGMIKWRNSGLPEETGKVANRGMSLSDFDKLTDTTLTVLVDFYAEWCEPCKKMKPYLEEISKEMAGKVIVIRINTDDHPTLCKTLKIDALPVLHIYKNKTKTWDHSGYIEKDKVVEQLLK